MISSFLIFVGLACLVVGANYYEKAINCTISARFARFLNMESNFYRDPERIWMKRFNIFSIIASMLIAIGIYFK